MTKKRFRRAIVALVALTVILSAFGAAGTVSAQSVSVSNSPSATTVAPGDTVTITTTISGSHVNGQGLQVSLPAGWQGEITDAGGGSAKPSSGTANVLEVVWLESGTYEVTYEVQVPSDATAGDYLVNAEGSGIHADPDNDTRIVDSAQTTITVEEEQQNQEPTASIDGPTSAQVGEEVTFTASASDDGSIVNYEWDLGDGTTATGETVTHTYDSAGSYEVSLTVTDDQGATTTATQIISINEAPDPANFQVSDLHAPSSVTQGDTAEVTATIANAGDEKGTQMVSLIVDDSEVASEEVTLVGNTSQQVSFSVDTTDLSTGQHDVTVATDDDSATAQFTVEELPPVGDFAHSPNDMDGDGTFEDVNGDESFDIVDVQALFANRDDSTIQNNPAKFDFNGDEAFDIVDVQALFNDLQEGS